MTGKAVLNTEEAAELLGLSPYTIREFAREGRIPGRKIGKEWRFSREALIRWVETPELETASNQARREE